MDVTLVVQWRRAGHAQRKMLVENLHVYQFAGMVCAWVTKLVMMAIQTAGMAVRRHARWSADSIAMEKSQMRVRQHAGTESLQAMRYATMEVLRRDAWMTVAESRRDGRAATRRAVCRRALRYAGTG